MIEMATFYLVLKGPVLRTRNRPKIELDCNQSYWTNGPSSTACQSGLVLNFHFHQHLLELLRTGLNWFSTGLTVSKLEHNLYNYLHI